MDGSTQTPSVEYATVRGLRCQVIHRFRGRDDCRVCGGDGYLATAGGQCPYCEDGKEREVHEYATVGMLEGPDAGLMIEVRAGALRSI